MNTLSAAKKKEKELRDEQIIKEVQENAQGLEILYDAGVKLKYKFDVKGGFTPSFWRDEKLTKSKKPVIELLASFGELRTGVFVQNGIATATDAHTLIIAPTTEKDGIYFESENSSLTLAQIQTVLEHAESETFKEMTVNITDLSKKVQYFYNVAKNNHLSFVKIENAYFDPQKLNKILYILRSLGVEKAKLMLSRRYGLTIETENIKAILMPCEGGEALNYQLIDSLKINPIKVNKLIDHIKTKPYDISDYYKGEERAARIRELAAKRGEEIQELKELLNLSLF